MKHSTVEIDPYRVQDPKLYRRALRWWVDTMKATDGHTKWKHAAPLVRAARYVTWKRTWQAEWNGCQKAPRAWTRHGVMRRANRWVRG